MHDADTLEPEPTDRGSGPHWPHGFDASAGVDAPDEPDSWDATDSLVSLDSLVGEWLSVPEAAQLQRVSLSTVRGQLKERELVAVRRGPNNAISIPARFVTADGPRPELCGTVIVLADGGMDDEELVRWLFTPDDTLPADGTPMGALIAGHKTEIRRRAMETAF